MNKDRLVVLILFVLFFSSLTMILRAEDKPKKEEPIIMTVGAHPVSLAEFKYIARKNGLMDFQDKKAVDNYIDLFVNFKRKVFAAEALKIHENQGFKKELTLYSDQARRNLLRNEKAEWEVVRNEYERYSEVVEVEQILVRLPGLTLSGDTLATYEKALAIYKGLDEKKNFLDYAKEVSKDDKNITFGYLGYIQPLSSLKVFENKIYGARKGVILAPFRSALGYHIVHIVDRKPAPGRLKAAHILLPLKGREEEKKAQFERADSIYNALIDGADFKALAKKYSIDKSREKGGELPLISLGSTVRDFESVVYSMKPGEISKPFQTSFGIHIVKLIRMIENPSFDEMKVSMYRQMEGGEWNFEIYEAWDEQLKKEHNYVFHEEAFDELIDLTKEYFPTDTAFINRGIKKENILFELDSIEILQRDFVYYVQDCPFSTKPYAEDFLTDVYKLFVRELMNQIERKNFDRKYPDFNYLLSEYRDGMLLFEISSMEVWNKAEQDEEGLKDYYEKNKANYSASFEQDRSRVIIDYQNYLEKKWEEKLSKQYPLKINKKVLKQLKK